MPPPPRQNQDEQSPLRRIDRSVRDVDPDSIRGKERTIMQDLTADPTSQSLNFGTQLIYEQ